MPTTIWITHPDQKPPRYVGIHPTELAKYVKKGFEVVPEEVVEKQRKEAGPTIVSVPSSFNAEDSGE